MDYVRRESIRGGGGVLSEGFLSGHKTSDHIKIIYFLKKNYLRKEGNICKYFFSFYNLRTSPLKKVTNKNIKCQVKFAEKL